MSKNRRGPVGKPSRRRMLRLTGGGLAGGTLYGATDLDRRGGVHAFDARTGALRWTFNDETGDHHAWLVATDGTHVFALHGEKLHALPVQLRSSSDRARGRYGWL